MVVACPDSEEILGLFMRRKMVPIDFATNKKLLAFISKRPEAVAFFKVTGVLGALG